MVSFLKKRVVYHSIVWVVGVAILFINIWRTSDNLSTGEALNFALSVTAPMLLVVYAHFYVRILFFKKRKYLFYVLSLLTILALGIGLDHVIGMFFLGAEQGLLQTGINLSSVILISTGFQFFKRGLVNQYYNQELKARNIEAELKMLRAQLNPHFMFNTLNNIYAINEIEPAKGSAMILELSDVMRYHLESTKLAFVTLEEEVKLIHSYISLEKLRLNDVTSLDVNIKDFNPQFKLSPVLLLPFIENAFKYGSHPLTASKIGITLHSTDNQLDFQVQNSIVANKKVVKSNIGLENTLRRLELIYPNKHDLQIENDGNYYLVKLTIHV